MITTRLDVQGTPAGTRLGSGYPTAELILPSLAPITGQVQIRAGLRRRNGRTADCASLVPALARHGLVLFAHTADNPEYKMHDLQLLRGQQHYELGRNVTVAAVGGSLQLLVTAVFQQISWCDQHRRPLPLALVVATANELWPGSGQDAYDSTTTASVLHALSTFDLPKVQALTGVFYQRVTGRPLPHLEATMAVVAYLNVRRTRWTESLDNVPATFVGRATSVLWIDRGQEPPVEPYFQTLKSPSQTECGRQMPMRFVHDRPCGSWYDAE